MLAPDENNETKYETKYETKHKAIHCKRIQAGIFP